MKCDKLLSDMCWVESATFHSPVVIGLSTASYRVIVAVHTFFHKVLHSCHEIGAGGGDRVRLGA